MRALAVMLAALAGCSGPAMLPRPAGGYQAIRFTQPMRVPGPLGNYEPGAGAMLVADRAVSGAPLYCGTLTFRDIMPMPAPVCATYADGLLTMNADKMIPGRPFPVPAGVIEETRLP